MNRRTLLKGMIGMTILVPLNIKLGETAMAILGQFVLTDYTSANGLWRVHFVNHDPGGGNPSDYYIDIPESELPANINQNSLATALKQRLGWTVNQTFVPLNTAIANSMTITLP